MKLSHLNGLRALEATLRNGTFTAAAEELGVTVAAIGQQIRGLEDYLGIRLFDRLPSGAKPTSEARAIATRLTTGFTQIEDALSELKGSQSSGKVSVSLSHYILDDWLSGCLHRFQQRAPDIEVRFHTGEEYVDLFSGDFDMAIRFSPEPGAEFTFESLHRGYFMPVCTPEVAQKYMLSPDTRDLTGVPLFRLLDQTNDPAWIGWAEIIKAHGLRKDDLGPIQQLTGKGSALSGSGLMLLGLTESFNGLVEGRLVAPFGPDFVRPYSFGYRLVWPAGRSLTRPMRQFRDWMIDERDSYLRRASEILGVDLT